MQRYNDIVFKIKPLLSHLNKFVSKHRLLFPDAIYVAEQTTGIVQNLLQKRIKMKLPDKFYMLNRTRE
jgi:hypothetical protein